MLGTSLGVALVLVLHAEPAPVEELQTPVTRREPVRFDAGARVEFRSGQPEGHPGTNLSDVEIDPVLALRLPFRTGSLTMAYEPRLFLVVREYPPQEAQKVAYLNRGRLVLDTTPDPRWQVYFVGRFAYGENDFLPLSTVTTPVAGTGAPPIQPGTTPTAPTPAPGQSTLPDTRFLPIIDIDASAGFVYSLSPRWGWRLSAGYLYYGGANAEVRATQLPLQKGPHGTTGLEWWASRADSLAFTLDVSNLRFSSGPQSTLATLTTTWTRAWGRSLGTDLLLGVGGIHSTAPPEPGVPGVHNELYPLGGLGLRYALTSRSVFWHNRLTFLAAPSADRISGAVTQRLSAAVQSVLSPIQQLILEVTATGSRSIDGSQRDTRLEGKATYLLGPQFGISLGGRAAWLDGSTLLGPQGFGWLAFLSVGSAGSTSLFGESK
jgi:hypothetical protein